MISHVTGWSAVLAVACTTAGCTINPVTGERELALVSAENEVAIGNEQYAPSRQMQGGDYVRDPALTSYVRQVGQRLADVSDRDLPYEFVILNSSVPNAWALPGGKIAVNRGLLLELDSEAELAAVLGHEIVHAAARHGALAMQRGLLMQGALVIAAAASRGDDYSGLALGAAGLGAQLINSRNGRQAELESDHFGIQYMSRAGYDPQAAVTLQQTFLRLSQDRGEQGWLAGLFASHPPSAERVEQNRQTAAELPAGGELGRDRYRNAVSNLAAAKPAYDAYDAGRRAFASDDLDTAAASAREAIGLVANEGHFHALLGDVERARGNYTAAIADYERALGLYDHFTYRLGKAESHRALRQDALAESEYMASIELLPTPGAYYGLGQIAERRGDLAGALENYRRAAGASGSAGDAARDAVVRLDLPANPGQYLSVAGNLDANGRLIVTLSNPTRYRVTDVGLRIRFVDASGRVGEVARTITATIAAGASSRFATGIGPLSAPDSFELSLTGARLENP